GRPVVPVRDVEAPVCHTTRLPELARRFVHEVARVDKGALGVQPQCLSQPLTLGGAGDHTDLPRDPAGGEAYARFAAHARSRVRGRGRAAGTAGRSRPATTRLRIVPMPSTVISTMS